MQNFIKRHSTLFMFFVIVGMTAFYLFPLFQGLVLLPLDLLVAQHNPWYYQATILVKNSFMEDSIIQMYPWRFFVFESLQEGIIPFWNPYTLMGTPFMASMKPMVFYPFTLLLFPFGPVHGWNILLFLQITLSLFFAYLFLREWKVSPLISLFGSLVFAFNTLMIGVLEFGSEGHVLLWFPLLFYAVKKFIDTHNPWFLSIAGFAFAFSILAGQLQYVIYASFSLFLFILAYGFARKITMRRFIPIFIFLFLGIGAAAVQLVPSIELFFYANRSLAASQQQFSQSLLDVVHILRLLAPDFFGNPVSGDYTLNYIEGGGYFGIIPLFFVIYASIFLWKRKLVKFCFFIIAIGILFSTQLFGQLLALSNVQVLTYGAGYRIFSLVYLPAAILAALGLSHFLKIQNKYVYSYSFLFLLGCLIIFGFVYMFKPEDIIFSNLIFPILLIGVFTVGLVFFFLLRKKIKYIPLLFLFFVLLVTFADLFRAGYRFLTFSNPEFLYPKNEVITFVQDKTQSSLARVYGLTDPEVGSLFHIASPEIYNPLYLKKSRVFMDTLLGKESIDLDTASRYSLAPRVGETLKRTVDILGVAYLVTGTDHNPSVDYFGTDAFESLLNPHRTRFERYDIFRNSDAHPRFGVFYSAVAVPNDEKALVILSDRTIDLRKQIILTKPPFIPGGEGEGSVKLLSYEINAASFEVNSTARGYFYLSDTWYPGWRAWVNGEEQEILSANYNFRAVEVPKGKSIVSFSYVPTHFYLGFGITFVSSLLLLVFPIWLRKKYIPGNFL